MEGLITLPRSIRIIGGRDGELIRDGETKFYPIRGNSWSGVAQSGQPYTITVPHDAVAAGGKLTIPETPIRGYLLMFPSDGSPPHENDQLLDSTANPAPFNASCSWHCQLGGGGSGGIAVQARGLGGNAVRFMVGLSYYSLPFDLGPGGHFGVAGDWWPSGAAEVGVRRFQNWGHLCTSEEQQQAVRDGRLIFYPTFLIDRNDWSADQIAEKYRDTLWQIGPGATVIAGNESNYQLPDAVEFARRFRAMVEGVKRVDPSARICGPSTLFYAQDANARAWWRGVLATGVGRLMNKIGHHSYTAHAVHDFANDERYWLVDPPTLLSELRLLRADCDADPTVAGKPILVSEGSMIHAEGPAGLPPDHPLVVAEARRFFGEFLPALKLEIGRLGVEAFLVFQTTETKWNDRQVVPNPVGMYDESGRLTEYARSLAALAAS